MSNKSAGPVDKIVGRNIRIYRLTKGITLDSLGRKLGVTFQQIQKYENGTSRVGSGRLYRIAALLNVPVAAFFESAESRSTGGSSLPHDLLTDSVSLRMVQAFAAITNKKIRRRVLALIEALNSSITS